MSDPAWPKRPELGKTHELVPMVRYILEILAHPTACVTQLDADMLREAVDEHEAAEERVRDERNFR